MDIRIRSIARAGFSSELVGRLYALASRLMAEDEAHFALHAHTNDVVHVFERVEDGALVGFQFWKTMDLGLPRARAIVGGKLRIEPGSRGRALHLRSGLRFYLQQVARRPLTRWYRLSVASVFGFTSIASALAEYTLFDPRASSDEGRAVAAAFRTITEASHYTVDEATGQIRVGIFMTGETLARYPDRFFDKPAAKIYAAANPDFRTNGCYLGFWFRFTPRNVASLVLAAYGRRRSGHSSSSSQPGQ